MKFSEDSNFDDNTIISGLKLNKIVFKEELENFLSEKISDKLDSKNVSTYYTIASVFELPKLSKNYSCFIERWFTTVINYPNFLELDYNSVAKILSSSGLNIDSEMEVFFAAKWWLSHNVKQRSKYAEKLFLKIRFSLLSPPALNFIIGKIMSFKISDVSDSLINEILQIQTDGRSNNLSTTVRYCNQTNFNIIVCGGNKVDKWEVVSDVYSFESSKIDNVIRIDEMNEGRQFFETLCVNGEVYVFGGRASNRQTPIMSVEKYSTTTKTWEFIARMYDKREQFCACSFMDVVYVIGGYLKRSENSCVMFNTKSRLWKTVSRLDEARFGAACTVFEGKIVVSGGQSTGLRRSLNSVEAYDDLSEAWSNLPNMIKSRNYHKMVAMKNKMFVVGVGETMCCEVYDSYCNNFVLLKPPPKIASYFLKRPAQVLSIGNKLVVFGNRVNTVVYYDVVHDEWSKELFELSKKIINYSCVKVPRLQQ